LSDRPSDLVELQRWIRELPDLDIRGLNLRAQRAAIRSDVIRTDDAVLRLAREHVARTLDVALADVERRRAEVATACRALVKGGTTRSFLDDRDPQLAAKRNRLCELEELIRELDQAARTGFDEKRAQRLDRLEQTEGDVAREVLRLEEQALVAMVREILATAEGGVNA
jgi:hypothetical protein